MDMAERGGNDVAFAWETQSVGIEQNSLVPLVVLGQNGFGYATTCVNSLSRGQMHNIGSGGPHPRKSMRAFISHSAIAGHTLCWRAMIR